MVPFYVLVILKKKYVSERQRKRSASSPWTRMLETFSALAREHILEPGAKSRSPRRWQGLDHWFLGLEELGSRVRIRSQSDPGIAVWDTGISTGTWTPKANVHPDLLMENLPWDKFHMTMTNDFLVCFWVHLQAFGWALLHLWYWGDGSLSLLLLFLSPCVALGRRRGLPCGISSGVSPFMSLIWWEGW